MDSLTGMPAVSVIGATGCSSRWAAGGPRRWSRVRVWAGYVTFVLADEAGRRLTAVQLVTSKIANAQEVASAVGVSGVTLWTWLRDYTPGGVAGLVRARTGPESAIKPTPVLTARIIELDAAGLTLLKMAARTGGFDRDRGVALGRVAPPPARPPSRLLSRERPARTG